jgi:hypothetical protein
MISSSLSICGRCFSSSGRPLFGSTLPAPKRRSAPAYASFLSHEAGVSPAGTISCGYS